MTTAYPAHPYLSGQHHPIRFEADMPDMLVEGELPKDLAGVFYRNGPDLAFPPRDDNYHWFDGDGMVFAFFIEDGRASMRNRWVRTDKLKKELEAGRKLYGTFGNPITSDMEAIGDTRYNTANTNIMLHGGQLLALMEGAPAVAMDPRTLETFDEHTYKGAITGPFSAHPTIDPDTDEMLNYGWMINGPFGPPQVRYDHVAANGELTNSFVFDVPYRSMMHTFLVTQNYVVFPILPLDVDGERAMKGGPMNAWHYDRPSMLGVMPRNGTADQLRWFEFEPRHMFHEYNAWDEDGKIVAIVAATERAPLFPDLEGNMPLHKDTILTLRRWELDLASGQVKETPLNDKDVQFPRADDRLMTVKSRHAFANTNLHAEDARVEGLDSAMRIDLETGQEDIYDFGPGFAVGELVVAPRLGAKHECDGYAMCMLYDKAEKETSLAVFHALDVAKGPIAKMKLPFRVPGGFHCNFHSADSEKYKRAFAA